MTVHSAKGLEFDVVFVTGLEEGLFPHENSANEPEGLEEERRLMYVAITRARKRLYLSLSQTRMLHGQTRYSARSRFLDELPEAALKWLTPKVQGPHAWGAWDGMRGRHGHASGGHAGQAGAGGRSLGGMAAPPLPGPGAHWARDGVSFRIGQGVRHGRFGEGVIIAIEGSGDDARAQINFGREGVKWLALGVAKLEAV